MTVARSSALRRAVFLCSLAGAGVAALSPDWARVLKAQGYYGDVDLAIQVVAPPVVRAGTEVDVYVSVRNGGPDLAHRVRTISSAIGWNPVMTVGCSGDSQAYPQCLIAQKMPSNTGDDYLIRMEVPQTARRHVQMAITAQSDDTETAPGDEIALFKSQVLAENNLKVNLVCDQVGIAVGNTVQCRAEFRNEGPAAAVLPNQAFFVTGLAATGWQCFSSRPELCDGTGKPDSWSSVPQVMFADDYITIGGQFVIDSTTDAPATVHAYLGAGGGDEIDLVPFDNAGHVDLERSIFANGFDGQPLRD
ncbi:hypothetical protein [Tahibacter amnicola]|uniref:DUF11 domain-containing protein n=1 Tax=Tahibacter amnicola TaxID=2976241 RepID=A0ABY6B8R2_9GAMM|nr:hypothetical protein [Tahibacter amnicola]UXI66409.1 hypothetical protein N4264_16835 [Tahibacter amnicola]